MASYGFHSEAAEEYFAATPKSRDETEAVVAAIWSAAA